MAVDIIARALAAQASQGGGSSGKDKIPVDVSNVVSPIVAQIDKEYCFIDKMSFSFPDDGGEIANKIKNAGIENVDLFFKVGSSEHHQAFTFEENKIYFYCFLFDSPQRLYNTIEGGTYLRTLSLICIRYDMTNEKMVNTLVYFISGNETPLYVTGRENRTFYDLESIKKILDYPGNQIIETQDSILHNNINNLFQGVIFINKPESTNLVTRIEHQLNKVFCGEYSKSSKQWLYNVNIEQDIDSIVHDIKIYNTNVYISQWENSADANGEVDILFSNGIPQNIVLITDKQIELTSNTPTTLQLNIVKGVPEVVSFWNSVDKKKQSKSPTVNFIQNEMGQIIDYFAAGLLNGGGISIILIAKEDIIIPAGTEIYMRLV